MALFELIIGLLFGAAVLALLAERFTVPYPALLALAGALLALFPGGPDVALEPGLALALFVAPTLLDAAFDASPRDLWRNAADITSLAVAMVAFTVFAVAWVVRLLVPDMPWAAAIALGAIVAPPDASAASAVLRKLRPPHRLMVILEGESLFNDATSLLIFRLAVGAAATGTFSSATVLPTFLVMCGGGAFAGWALGRLYVMLLLRIQDLAISVLLQFISTFAVWLLAEHTGLSAIIAVVAFAMTLARTVPQRVGARHRIGSYAVWEVAVLILNVLAFMLIGLQLKAIIARLESYDVSTFALCATAVCVTVVVVRMAWIFGHRAVDQWWTRRRRHQPEAEVPTTRNAMLASWCGMRGIVTLASALALPDGEHPFPYRDLIVFCAFCVVLSTLVVQGLTLKPLMRWLAIADDDSVAREVGLARRSTVQAVLKMLDHVRDRAPAFENLRREYEARLQTEDGSTPSEGADHVMHDKSLYRDAVRVQREEILRLRSTRVVGDDAFHIVEEELDLLELHVNARR